MQTFIYDLFNVANFYDKWIFFFLFTTLFWLLITVTNLLPVVPFEDNPLLFQSIFMINQVVFEIIGRWKWVIINLLPKRVCCAMLLLYNTLLTISIHGAWKGSTPSTIGSRACCHINLRRVVFINTGRVVLWIWGELSLGRVVSQWEQRTSSIPRP